MQFLGVLSVLLAITLGVWIALNMIQNTIDNEPISGAENYHDVLDAAGEAAGQLERRQ